MRYPSTGRRRLADAPARVHPRLDTCPDPGRGRGRGRRRIAAARSSPCPPPFGPARNGSLVYAKGGDIYLADADGSNPRAIITGDTDRLVAVVLTRRPDDRLRSRCCSQPGPDGRQRGRLERAPAPTRPTEWNAEFMPSDDEMVATRTVDGHHGAVDDRSSHAARSATWTSAGSIPNYWPDASPARWARDHLHGEHRPGRAGPGHLRHQARWNGPTHASVPLARPSQWQASCAQTGSRSRPCALARMARPSHTRNWEPKDAMSTTSGDYLHLRDLDTGAELPLPIRPRPMAD